MSLIFKRKKNILTPEPTLFDEYVERCKSGFIPPSLAMAKAPIFDKYREVIKKGAANVSKLMLVAIGDYKIDTVNDERLCDIPSICQRAFRHTDYKIGDDLFVEFDNILAGTFISSIVVCERYSERLATWAHAGVGGAGTTMTGESLNFDCPKYIGVDSYA